MKGTNKLPEVASLHETAVQAVARGEVDPVPAPRKKRAQKAVSLDRHIKVLPAVWAKAQQILSNGHGYTKIEILDHETVVVR